MSKPSESKSTIKFLLVALFIVYMYFLIRIILFKGSPINLSFLVEQAGRMLEHPDRMFNRHGNYVPFREISRDLRQLSLSDPFSSLNLVGNLLVFIPFGIFVSMRFSQQSSVFARVFLLSLALSLSFEVTQLVCYIGTFDVDDLILNTSGGVVGYALYKSLNVCRMFTLISKR